jgi:hypothetical protein
VLTDELFLLPFPTPQSDNFELDDAFAEYFMSEPDYDTCHTTSSMVSPMVSHRRAAANDMATRDQMGSTVMDMDQWKPTPGPGNSVYLANNKVAFSTENDGAVDAASQQEPPTKKACLAVEAPYLSENKYHQMFNEYEHFLANPQRTKQYKQQIQQPDVPQEQHNFAQQVQTDASVSLPVGNVGIHDWGKVGGIVPDVPATVQSAPSSPTAQNQFTMEGYDAQQGQQHNFAQPDQTDASVSLPVGNVDNQHWGDVGGTAPLTIQCAPSTPMVKAQSYTIDLSVSSETIPGCAEVTECSQKKKNREYAKQFRVRTKSLFESLREELASLKIENQDLRTIVKEHIPIHATQIITDCSYAPNPESADTDAIKSAAGAKQQGLVEPDRARSKHPPNPLNVPT